MRCFDDPNVVHINEKPDPKQDIEIIQLELVLADLEQVDHKIDKLSRQIKGDKKLVSNLNLVKEIKEHLQGGFPLSTFANQANPDFISLNNELRFLRAKPVIFVANMGEQIEAKSDPYVSSIKKIAEKENSQVVAISALFESDLNQLDDKERQEYLALSGVSENGLDQII